MNFNLRPLFPILVIGLFAAGSSYLVETPVYPVSRLHCNLVFLLGIFAWFYGSFGILRQSRATYAASLSFGYLALVAGLFPDMWLRWPSATLVGAAVVVFGAMLAWKAGGSAATRGFLGALVCGVALVPLGILPYYTWTSGISNWVAPAATGCIWLAGGLLWATRQRLTTASIFTWLFFALLFAALSSTGSSKWATEIAYRMRFEELLLFATVVLGAVFMADQLNVDKHLRRVPQVHLDASLKDQLTGLANRRALEMHGPQMIAACQEASRAVSLIVTDIDHFKDVNDTHGHLAGDAVLRAVTRNLAAHVRKSDLVARYGGEEFVIILPGSPLAPALRLAERMRNDIEATTVEYDGRLLRVTASFGVVTAFPEDSLSLDQLIEWADNNMYRAKRTGRNRVMTDEVRAD